MWASTFSQHLAEHGIIYPNSLLDQEGFGHHLLSEKFKEGIDSTAEAVISCFNEDNASRVLLSCEGLTNLISAESEDGADLFLRLQQKLREANIELTLIFTLRDIYSYCKSIYVQNLLYSFPTVGPSSFIGDTVAAVARAYGQLVLLLPDIDLRLLHYSSRINEDIMSIMDININNVVHSQADCASVVHKSPQEYELPMWSWIRLQAINIPADFHSYLRFSSRAQVRLENLFKRASAEHPLHIFADHWKPNHDFISACVIYDNLGRHFDSAIPKAFCPHSSVTMANLVKTISNSPPHSLVATAMLLDWLHSLAVHKSLRPLFESTFLDLLNDGSDEYGQNFRSQINR